jgi:ATP-binding cassette, subfamily B, multidrug efflux pump
MAASDAARASGGARRDQVRPEFGFGPRGGPGGPFGGMLNTQRAQDALGTLRRLWGYLRRQGWRLMVVVVLVLFSTGLGLLTPYLMGTAIDKFIGHDNLPGLARIVGLMLAAYAAQSLVWWLQVMLMIRVSQATVLDLRRDLFARLQGLPLRFFDERAHGELMSRLTNDIENVNMVLQNGVTSFISACITLPAVIVIMLRLNVPLAIVSFIIAPVMVVVTRYIARHSRQGFRDQQATLGVLNGAIEESITGSKVIKAYGREEEVIADFDGKNAALRAAAIRAQTYTGVFGPVGNLIGNLSFAIVAAAGAWMTIAGLATVGTVVAFLSYSEQLRRPIIEIANLFNSIQAALAGAERVFQVMDEPPEEAEAGSWKLEAGSDPLRIDAKPPLNGNGRDTGISEPATALGTIAGKVVFEDVTFGYKPGVPVLKHVNLTAEPGQTIALVGPTGAGKTTIINVLSRFYELDEGRILIDDHDIRTLPRDDLRRQLGVVLQDTYLFSDTVKQNIRYGRLDATGEEIIAAAAMANADHFIHHLPHGYDTLLSERAGNLSQGQRQLLAIARAILADPRILVLDEATSSVDTRTEVQIQEALLRLMQGRTSFVIAHRLSTIREADKILVIDNGEIVEQGTHAELLAARGFYYRLYMSQFKGTLTGE